MKFEKTQTYNGFVLKRSRRIDLLDATLHELEHAKSGARLCWLERADNNKTFAITFKTVPSDDTGVFHILEHSVLCGSDRFPVKEPFVELLKGSLNTFLNALTYPDKTMYPVASRNDKDFLNLVEVYMDAVLHPAIYHKPEIFEQEGWHYELNDRGGEASYKGVVYNEMKGAYASVDRLIGMTLEKCLFPDNCYGCSSGGDPEKIPTLTYESFLDHHRRFYHPSCALIFLDGEIRVGETLALLDSFLKDYDRDPDAARNSFIPMQGPVPSKTLTIPYEITAGEDKTNKTHITFGRLTGDFNDKEEALALSILCETLAGSNEAPVTKAILSVGLGQDVNLELNDGMQQSFLSLSVRNTEADKLDAIRKALYSCLKEQADGALDHEDLTANINHLEFKTRERDFGGAPAGLVFAGAALDTWLYGGDPIANLDYTDLFGVLRDKMNEGYFEALIRKYFLPDEHLITVVAVPSDTLGGEKIAAEKARLDAARAAWTDADLDAVLEMNRKLTAWQKTPDTPEQLATIPGLSLSDIQPEPEQLPIEVTTLDKLPLLKHDLPTNGITYLRLYFDVSDIDATELSALSFFTDLLTELGTERTDALLLRKKIKNDLGNLSVGCDVYSAPGETGSCRVFLSVLCSTLESNLARAVELITEVLNLTDFSDTAKIRDLLSQDKIGMEQRLIMRGHGFAMNRLVAYHTSSGLADEQFDGYAYLNWLKDTEAHFDERAAALSADLRRFARTYFNRRRLTLSVAGHADEQLLTDLIRSFPDTAAVCTPARFEPLGIRQEGIRIPAGVSFTATGANLYQHGASRTGQWVVASKILSLNYLWNAVRVQGGAYGTGMRVSADGDVSLWSYRDPNAARTLDCDRAASDFLRKYAASEEDITPLIVGTISDTEPLLTPRTSSSLSDARYFTGRTHEDACRLRREILSTKKEDLAPIADMIDTLFAENAVCVIAGQDKLDACGDKLNSILSL